MALAIHMGDLVMSRYRFLLGAVVALGGLSLASPLTAACPTSEEVTAFLTAWESRQPAPGPGRIETMADAYCGQKILVERLSSGKLGKPVGYKAGLTNKAVQERFGATEPARGVLLAGMILSDGAKVPAAYGARAVWEADLILKVKEDGINAAKTPEEALRHLSHLIPFIELPDLAVAKEVKLDAGMLTAINVAARWGVAGAELPLQADAQTVAALAAMKITAYDASGAALGEATGSAVLGSPLNVVLWLVTHLRESGLALKAGDLLSVGSFTPLTAPKAGQRVTVRYEGLPGSAAPTVTVSFE